MHFFYVRMILTILAITKCFLVFGQANHSFHKITVNDGLPHSDVTSIVQDQKGFIWFGTYSGLCRFDGLNFKLFKHDSNRSNSLSNNRVISQYISSDSTMYIGTEAGGLNIFDPYLEDFKVYKHDSKDEKSIVGNVVYSIYESKDKSIWIGTNKGLDLLKRKNDSIHFERIIEEDIDVKDIQEIGQGLLWVATNVGLYQVDINDGTSNKILPELNVDINQLLKLKGGKILIASPEKGLILYENEKLEVVHPSPASALFMSHDASIWVGTNGEGLFRYDFDLSDFEHYKSNKSNPANLNFNEISSLFEDSFGILWIGTYGGGVNKLNLRAKEFALYSNTPWDNNSISGDRVISFYQSKDSLLWIGVRGGGINVLDRKTDKVYRLNKLVSDLLHKQSVSAFHEDSLGTMWVGFWGGVVRLTKKDRKDLLLGKQITYDTTLWEYSVEKIINDDEGHLWFSTTNGLIEYIPGKADYYKGTYKTYLNEEYNSNSLSDNFIRDIFIERQSNDGVKVVWVGTINGLNRMSFEKNGTRIQRIFNDPSKSNSLPANFISIIHQDKNGDLWISTLGGGLCKMLTSRDGNSEPTFLIINEHSGLINNEVETLLEEDNGNFWLGSYGLTKYSPQKNEFKYYDVSDGLQSNAFKVWSAFKTTDGEMVFGGTNGFNIFHPSRIIDNEIPPKLVFTDFKINNKSIDIAEKYSGEIILDSSICYQRKIVLPYSLNNFSIQFAALHFASSKKNQYRFKLEGIDKDWIIKSGLENNQNYSNLNPGDYRFILYGSNSDNVWAEDPLVLDVIVMPPFWANNYAYTLYVILLLGLLLLFRKYSIIQENEKNKLKLERFKRKQLEELSKLKMRFFTNVSHEFRTPLSLMVGPVEELAEQKNLDAESRRKVDFIHRNIKRLTLLVDEIMDFRKYGEKRSKLKMAEGDIIKFINEIKLFFNNEANRRNIEYSIHTDLENFKLYFDRTALEKVFFNLLNNAFKYAPNGAVVHMECKLINQNEFKVSISNTGSKISEEDLEHIFERYYRSIRTTNKGTGIGLAIVKSVIDQHKGRIWAENIENGVVFSFILPTGKNHLEDSEVTHVNADSERVNEYLVEQTFDDFDATTPPLYERAIQSKPKKILIVEDNDELRAYLDQSLGKFYNIVLAHNGKVGLEKALSENPDIIISDVMMPEMDGISMCSAIKSNVGTSHIPVIILTARTSILHQIDGYEMGADSYLTKPFSTKLLISRVKNLLDLREKLRASIKEKLSFSPSEVTVTSIDKKILEKTIKAIEKNISDPDFKVEDLCKEVGLSRPQLYRKLKSLTSYSINDFIRIIRLKRAAQILKVDNSSVSEVMYQVGFTNSSYFTRAFKAEFGTTPKEYGSKVIQ